MATILDSKVFALALMGKLSQPEHIQAQPRFGMCQRGSAKVKLKHGSGKIRNVAFTPDGRGLAVASTDSVVRLYDLSVRSPTITRQAHQGIVFTSDFSPNGQLLATGSHDTSIVLWDTFTGKAIDTLPGRRQEAHVRGDFSPFSLSFSPDGRTIASGSSDGMVKLWDMRTRQVKATLSEQSRVASLCFGPEGRTVAAGMKDGAIAVWDVGSKQPVVSISGHENSVGSIGLSPNGKILASGSGDRSIKLWDVPSGRERATLLGHSGGIFELDFSSDGKTLVSGSYDTTIRLWDIQTGTEKATLRGHTKGVSMVCFSSDGQCLASCSWDGTVRLWDVTTGEEQAILRAAGSGEESVWTVAISSNGDWIASGKFRGTLDFWDCRAPRFHALLMGHENDVQNVRFNTDGTKLQSTDVKGNSVFWDLHTGNRLTENVTDSFPLESSRSPDEKLVVKIVGRNIYLIDATTHRQNGQRWVDSLVSQPKLFAGDQAWAGTRESYRQLVDVKPSTSLAWTELMDVTWWDDWTNGRSLDSAMAIYPEARKALGEGLSGTWGRSRPRIVVSID